MVPHTCTYPQKSKFLPVSAHCSWHRHKNLWLQPSQPSSSTLYAPVTLFLRHLLTYCVPATTEPLHVLLPFPEASTSFSSQLKHVFLLDYFLLLIWSPELWFMEHSKTHHCHFSVGLQAFDQPSVFSGCWHLPWDP